MGLDLDSARPNRTELTLRQIGQAWAVKPDGPRFSRALVAFLKAQQNPNTQRAYSFSVLQFFGFMQERTGAVPTPREVGREDAAAYDHWLRNRQLGLREHYLERDPSRRLDLALYEIIKQHPGIGRDDILVRLSELGMAGPFRERPDLLDHRLACLVSVHTLERTPSVADIRALRVDVGLSPEEARRAGLDVPVPGQAFSYRVPEKQGSSAERSTTVLARLSALSALWQSMIAAGDNRDGPLLRVNVFSELTKKASRQSTAQSRRARQEKTPSRKLVEQLLATTYQHRYGPQNALSMASMLMEGRPVAVKVEAERYNDLRDRLMILALGQMGLRAEELGQLRRQDYQPQDAVLTVSGKGDKVRRLRVPPPTQHAFSELSRKLEQLAAHQKRQGRVARGQALLSPAAPLVPAISRWGANAAPSEGPEKGLSRSAIAMALRRRAQRAGIEPGSDAFRKIHPHGLRHLFTKMALSAGTPINVVQAMLGHSSGAQTLAYAEEHEPEKLVSRAYAEMPAPSPPQPEPALEAPAEPPESPEPTEPFEAPAPDFPAWPEPPEPQEAKRAAARLPPVVEIEPAEDEPEPEGLVGVGAPPSPEALEQPEEPPAAEQALSQLDRIYEENWGERGNRSHLGTTALPEAEALRQTGVEAELAELSGAEEIVEPIGGGDSRIGHTYVGKASGLLWWAGWGKLDPEMPVMSPAQKRSCDPDEQTEICARLIGLWERWMSAETRGPTAAAALSKWLAEALITAEQVAYEVRMRDGRWVAPDAPWEETADQPASGKDRTVFREHEPSAIVSWFEQRAYRYGRYTTRGQKVMDKPMDLPDYYALSDPIAALPPAERADLLDWIAALTGRLPRSQMVRFERGSRADVAGLVQAMCAYDLSRDNLKEMRAEKRIGEATESDVEVAKRALEQAREDANRAARGLGKLDFDIAPRVEQRVAKRRLGERQMRQQWYLKVVAEVIGPQAAADPAVELVARCGQTPLSDDIQIDGDSWEPSRFFAVDWSARTIVHDRAFAEAFARQTGQHSECVARRLARELYELKRKQQAGQKQRLLQRPDELSEWVQTMAAYRVPCADALEYELSRRIGDRQPVPIYSAFEAAREKRGVATEVSTRSSIEEELSELEEAFGEEIAQDFYGQMFENPARCRPHRCGPAARRMLPSPIRLVWAALV